MKKLSILLSITLTIFMCSCGGNSNKKEEAKGEVKKETKKLSKDTKEGMMAILKAADIEVPNELEYDTVKKKTDSYVISFKNDSISEEALTSMNEWFTNKINELDNAGWKKFTVRENEEMLGFVINEIMFYPPANKDIDVSYGITLSTSYDKEKKAYIFYIDAN